MSLIKCPECQKEISDTAIACPNCGCPIANKTEPSNNKANVFYRLYNKIRYDNNVLFMIGVILILIMCGIFAKCSKSPAQPTAQSQYTSQPQRYNIDNIIPGVTQENYNIIQEGMTLSEVTSILGSNCVHTEEIGTVFATAVEYGWCINSVVHIEILFVDDKVYSKFGFGLEQFSLTAAAQKHIIL